MAEATARKIDEIRQKYPAYKDVPDDKLAAALHKKFYAARSQAEVFERLGVPYPEQLVAPEPPPRQAMPDRLSASEPPPMAPRPAAPAPGIAPAVAPLSPGTPFPRGFDAFSENLSVIPQSQMGVGRPAARPERGAPEAPAAPVQIGPAVALGEEDIAPVEDVAGANQLTREYGSLFVRGVAEIPAGMVRDVSIAGAQRATEQRTILDRIDRGEQVDLGGDPVFGSAGRLRADLMRYQAMSPEDRARVRPMLEDELGAVDPRQRPAYQAGEGLSQAVEQAMPVSDQTAQSIPGQVSSGLGSAVGFIGTGIVGRAIGLPPVLAVSVPGAATSSAGQFQQALQDGASFEEAFAASDIMRLVGVGEAVPIANLFERFDKGTGGRLRATLINTAAQGGEEAVQEAFQTIMGNLTESTFVGYNPETGIFDGVGDAATVGGIVGAILGALTGFGGRHAPPAPQSEIDRRLDALGARATGMADRGEAFNAQMADKAQETPPAVVPPPVPAPTGDAGLSPQPAAAPPVEEEADPSLQDTLQTIEGTLRGPPEPAPREELDAVLEAVDAGAKPEEAVDAAAARREQMRVEAEQQAQAAAAGEAQAAADAEAAQQAEAAAQVAADAQARVEAEEASDSTGLASMGSGMAQAMGENLRERLWQEYAGQAQAIDPLAIRARREAPGMSREEFIAWAEAVDAGREPPVRAQPPGTTPQPKAQDEAPAAPAQAEPAPERPTGDAFDAMTAEDWRRRIPELEAGVARAEAALASEKESGGSGVNVNLAKREVAQAKRYVAKARKRLAELEAETPATPPAPPQDARKPEPAPAAKQEPEAAPAAAAGGEAASPQVKSERIGGGSIIAEMITVPAGAEFATTPPPSKTKPGPESAARPIESMVAVAENGAPTSPRVIVNRVGRDGMTDAERGGSLPPASSAPLTVESFSDKAIIIKGDTKTHKDRIKAVGGARWNRKAGGWIFPKTRETAVLEALAELLGGDAKPAETPKKPDRSDRPFKLDTIAAGGPTPAYRDWVETASDEDLRKMAELGGLEGRYAQSEVLARDHDREQAAKPKANPGVPVEDDRKRERLRKAREAGQAAARSGARRSPPDMFRGDLHGEWLAGYADVAAPAAAATYGSTNKVFTEDAAAKARAILKAKLSGTQLNSGLDPEIVQAGITLAGYHIEAGARSFAAFTKAMIEDLGDAARPHLRSWYEGVRYYPGFDAKGMTPAAEIDGIIAGDQETETESVSVPEPDAAPADDRPGDEGSGATVPPATADAGQAASGDRAEDGAVRRDPVGPSEPGVDEDSQGGELQSPAGRRGSGGRSGAAKRGAGAGGGPRVSDYRAEPGSLKREGSWQATAERNIDIVELVNRLEAEGRPATSDEQAQIAKFTGWGASEIRQNLFATATRDSDGVMRLHPERHYRDNGWKPLVERAAKLLEGEDLDAAMRSSQYAHYTSEPVVRAIWNGVERMGFKGGRILEPGMGSGLFAVAGPAPVLDASRYTGIEFDKMTAAVAKALLPKQNILHADYVEQKLPDGFFDLGIGNPPFARISITQDPAYRRYRFSLHDYFFAKTIDKVRPGGLLVFVTSRYTMDKADDKARAYLADRADLLGAIRMPQTTFKQNAGTEVVTDVLFLRKRIPGEAPGGHPWRSLKEVDAGGEPVLINEFFVDNPANVLGSHSTAGSMYRENEYTVLPPEGSVEDAFAKVVGTLPENVMTEAAEREEAQQQARTIERDFNVSDRKEGSLYVSDAGDVMVVESGSGVPVDELRKVSPKQRAWLKDYAGLRDAVKVAHKDQLTDGDWQKSLKALNKAYDAFVKKHGRIMAFSEFERESVGEDGEPVVTVYRRYKNEVLLRLDVEHPLIFALEKVGEDGTISKGRFLLDRTLDKPKPPKIETAQDAMMVTLDQVGRLDLGHIAGLLDSNVDQVIEDLGSSIYRTPEGEWQTADEYLSGDVRAKLEQARVAADADPAYERNVKALIDVQPRPLAPQEITVSLGSGWVPAEVVNTFTNDVLDLDTVATYEPALGKWTIPESSARSNRGMASEWGTKKISPYEILSAVLNNREIKVRSTVYENGKPKQIPDPAGTQEAQQIATKMRDRFRSWVWTDGGRAKRLAEIYNTRFNNIAPRRFDGSHLTTPGLSLKYNLHPHQKRAIWRIIQTGNTYLGHAVGAGKTLEMIVSAMEQRRLGMVRKPLFVVPNHMLNQFASEFIDAYPAAQIMVADEKGFHTDNRRRFIAQATLNDLDAIIITHSSFGKLDTKLESRQQIVQDMIAEIEAAIAANSGQDNRVLRRKLEAQKETIERRFLGKTDASEKDQALAFEEMGIDFLYLDEAHEFRKLDIITEMNAKGITPEGSKRALDLYIKTRWLQAQRPGRSMVFASGTPVTNTMGELHTVMRFMDEAALEADGLKAFDAWATQFGEVASSFEQNAAGQYESVARFAKFNNVPELMSRVRSFMDVLTSNQLRGLVKLPDLETGSPQNVVVPASDALKAYMRDELAPRIKAARDWKPTPHEKANPDPLINIITDARLSAIDMRFADPNAPDDPSSKLNRMVDGIIKFHKESARATFAGEGGKPDPVKGAAQIVFSSVGFGEMVAKNRGFDVRGHIMRRLKKAGVKPSEVAWMSDFKSHAKKQTLFKEMREGKVRILFGSPKNMGTGLNVQKRLRALHYLSPPWYPSDVEQPHGRILRQGNQNENVDIFWYATKGTYDSTAWGMVARKARFIEQAFTGDATVRTIEDISETSQYEMASAMAAGDERMIQLAGLSSDVERLALLREAHFSRQQSLQHDERRLDRDIKSTESSIATAKAGLKAIEKASGPRRFEIGDVKTEKPTEATAAIAAFMAKEMKRWVPKTAEDRLDVEIGTYAGLAINGRLYAMKDGKSLVPFADAGIEAGPAYERILHLSGAETLDGLTEGTHYGVAKSASDWVNGGLRRQLYARETELEEYRKELATTKKQIGAPFEFEGELAEKVAERERLQAEMLAEGAELPANTAMPERDAIEAWEGEGGALGAADPRFALRAPVTDTPEFKRWFGKSKVVDQNGEPLVVYHNTHSANIEEFLPKGQEVMAGDREGSDRFLERFRKAKAENKPFGLMQFRSGSFFTPHKDEYAGYGPTQYAVYIKAENPAYFEMAKGAKEKWRSTDPTKTPDALIMTLNGEIQEIAVIDPTQIKSATDNRGTFDPSDPRISYRLTDKAKAKLPALERDLRARLEKLGIADKVALRVVEAIRQNVRGQVVEADAMWLRGAITVALDAADAAGALNHEVIHALRELGMFTRSEWRALERAARADGDLFAKVRRKYDGLGLTEAQILEEVIAEHYRMWADGRAQNGGLMRRAFEKLRDFFRALGQALRGQGLTTAEGVFERVESGRVGRRGDRDVAQPSDLWAAVGAGLTVAGVAAKAGMFNGMFSKRVATDTPEFPSQRAKEAWQMGERHRREFADGDVDPSQLSEDDLGFVATIEASQPVARAFYESARRGAKKPALKRGTRKGAAPKGGTSRNWVDNRGEIGVSMANVEGVDYQWFPTGERMSSDVVEYEGWLLDPDEFWGSDGEPLMVGIKPVPDPPISFSLRQPPSGTTALDHAKATAGKHVGKPTPLKESIAQWWEKTTENGMNRSIQATIDRFHSLRVLEQRMLGDNQSRFDASHHMAAFTSAHFAMNESAYMHAAMYYGPPRLNRAEGVVEFDDGTKSLLTLLEPLDTQEKIDAFELYAWARRANELKRSGREPAPQSDIDDGLALAREYPELRQVFDDWTAFNRKVVAFARDSGLITDEAARSYLADAHYVPFYRAEVDSQGRRLADRSMSSGSGITNMRSGIKRLKGSDKAVAGIIDNMVRNTERLIARSYRNIAAQKATALMIGASQQFGEEIIKKPPPKWALELVPMKMLEKAVSGAGLNVDFSNLSAAEKREIVGIWGMVPPAFRAPDGSMMFSVMIAGKPQWFVTTDPMLFESLSSLTPRQMGMIANTLFQIARAPARMLRWGVTNEPTFAIANFLRDTASTFVVYGAGPGHLARVMARFFKRSASGIVYGERFNDRSVAEIQAAGGGIGGWWSEGPSSVRKALQAQRRDVSLARKAGRAAMGFWKRYQEVLRASEQANRIVLYDRLRAKGTSKAEAAFQAMDVTNFSARGSSEAVRILVELTPFLNARIQGLNRLYRGAAHKLSGNAGPYRSTRTGFVVNGLILMAATMALYAVNYDDEDYADLEGWERDLYYHIRLPKFLEEATGARWFRIPRPFEVGVIFSTLPERAMDQVFRLAGSEAKRDEDLTALRESLFRAATDTFAVQPTQIGKIAMEQWSNWSTFLGRSIVPTYEQEGLPPYMQYGPGTSEAAKWIGRQTGASPRRIEHLIRELGGSMAAHALVAADSAISQAQGRTDPARRWYEMPVISRFVRGDSVYTRWAERYYTLQQETDALVATINKLEREGADPAEIDALDTDEHRDRRQFFRGTRKDLRGIRDDMSDIYADPGMTPEAKRQALDELRRERTSIYREVRDLTVP